MKYTAVGRSESMALSVYVGRAGTGKTQACFEHVKQVIESNPGEPILYIVPDSATYTIERSLAEFMPQGRFYHRSRSGF